MGADGDDSPEKGEAGMEAGCGTMMAACSAIQSKAMLERVGAERDSAAG